MKVLVAFLLFSAACLAQTPALGSGCPSGVFSSLGCSTTLPAGLTIGAINGPLQVGNSGGYAGLVGEVGNTTVPPQTCSPSPCASLPASNYVGDLGPNSVSFSSYFKQWPASAGNTPGLVVAGAINIPVTFTNGSAVITGANSLPVGAGISMATVGGSFPTNFTPCAAVCYVISAGLSSSQFEVSTTYGGTAIIANSAGTGTTTVTSNIVPMTFNTVLPFTLGLQNGTNTSTVGTDGSGNLQLAASSGNNVTFYSNNQFLASLSPFSSTVDTFLIGVAGSITGKVLLNSSGSTFTSLIQPANTPTANSTYTLPPSVIPNGDLFYCATSSTTCTLTDAGYMAANVAQTNITNVFSALQNFNLGALGSTFSPGIQLNNTTASNGTTNQQYPPAINFCGTAYNSAAPASETDCWQILGEPTTAAGATTDPLFFRVSLAGGAYSNVGHVLSNGDWILPALDVTGSSVQFAGVTSGAGTYYGCLSASGTGTLTYSSSNCGSSLLRLKENIYPLDGQEALDNVMRMRPVEFDWKQGTRTPSSVNGMADIGMVADWTAAIDSRFGSYDKDGNLENWNDRPVLATAIKAIQELKQENDALRARIAALEAR